MIRFKNILYVHQDSPEEDGAIARAVSLAENNQASLTLIEVIPALASDVRERFSAGRRQALEALCEPYRGRVSIALVIAEGTVFLEVIRAVARAGHDLVVKAAEKRDFMKRLFGSDDMHLLRKCPCPVWLMKPREKSNYNSILAAVDFDPLKPSPTEEPLNRLILELASSLALSDFAALHLVHAWDAPAERVITARGDSTAESVAAYVETERSLHQRAFASLGELLRDRIGSDAYSYLAPHFHLVEGPPQKVIARTATEVGADLVVMGTVARTGIAGFIIGNTAEAVLEQLDCSVLAVKPPGFVTPVTV